MAMSKTTTDKAEEKTTNDDTGAAKPVSKEDPKVVMMPTSGGPLQSSNIEDAPVPRKGDPYAHQRDGGSEEGKKQIEEGKKADKDAEKK